MSFDNYYLNQRIAALEADKPLLERRIAALEKKAPDYIPDAKFKKGQVVINTLNDASFTIRQMRWHVDQWQYSNTRLDRHCVPNWVCETKLRELNDTEKGL